MDFSAFVAAHSRDLLRTGWLLTGEWAAAEDLVQTALLACLPRWASVSAPLPYVRAAIARSYLSDRRRRWRDEVATADLPDRPGPDAWDAVDVRSSVRAALGALTTRERAVVVLRYYADLSEAETADLLGLARGSVKRYAADGLAKLRVAPSLSGLLTQEVPQ